VESAEGGRLRRRPANRPTAAVGVTRVLLVGDQLPISAGIRLALTEQEFEIVAEAATAAEALQALGHETVDVCLVDGELSEGPLEAVRALHEAVPQARIVLLSAAQPSDARLGVLATFDAGASGWLRKDVRPARLPVLLRAVRDGERLVPRSLVGALIDEVIERRRRGPAALIFPNGSSLTAREAEVLELVAEGTPTGRIAAVLGISDVTVRRHLSDATRKLGVEDRAAAARLFRTVQSEWAGRPIDVGRHDRQPRDTSRLV
jgi:DNA-binding NarL/FixJ family response regulator